MNADTVNSIVSISQKPSERANVGCRARMGIYVTGKEVRLFSQGIARQ